MVLLPQTQIWTGIAETRMAGLFLVGPGVYVDLLQDHWPPDVEGRQVSLTGVAVEKHDLPVFIAKPGKSPQPQGIAEPPGTDLYTASARVVIENPEIIAVGK